MRVIEVQNRLDIREEAVVHIEPSVCHCQDLHHKNHLRGTAEADIHAVPSRHSREQQRSTGRGSREQQRSDRQRQKQAAIDVVTGRHSRDQQRSDRQP